MIWYIILYCTHQNQNKKIKNNELLSFISIAHHYLDALCSQNNIVIFQHLDIILDWDMWSRFVNL